ncbi:MAG: hypothetical protein K8U57_31600 [Planctomycetes bacterium]|nr:hypothetical protein [Planctomycetota bacterium]
MMNPYTTETAAELVGATRREIWSWIRRGWVCPAVVVGRTFGFDEANIATLERCKQAVDAKREAAQIIRQLLNANSHPTAQV